MLGVQDGGADAGGITVMNRFTKFFCNLMVLGVPLGLTIPAVAGPTTPCANLWGGYNLTTVGKGQSPSNNPKVSMSITGNIVDPASLKPNAHRIPVCSGTLVTVSIVDISGGLPTVTVGGSLSCNSAGCTGVVNVTEKFKVVSSDGKDTDRMTLLPK